MTRATSSAHDDKDDAVHPDTAARPDDLERVLGSPRRVWIDKNLASLGFFTPSSQRIKREKSKVVQFSQVVDGERAEVSATIVPSALHGLPVTADQDKFLALLDVLRSQRPGGAPISNPVSFSTTALLRSLGLSDSGQNHLDVGEWLDLMASTTIISEGAVYLSGSRRWARDRFRVFERAVSRGQQLHDGSTAEHNLVWLSDWQLQNANNRHLLPIDLDLYRRLKTHIGRALVLHLQIWLYASQRAQRFEKRYADLCQLLGVRPYEHHSKIVEKLGPALEELAAHGYLAGWAINRMADERDFKVVLTHGPLFGKARAASSLKHHAVVQPSPTGADESLSIESLDAAREYSGEALVCELAKRGVSQGRARHLLGRIGPRQDVRRQIEWADSVSARGGRSIRNPAGFLVSILRDNIEPPPGFLSSRERRERDRAHETLIRDRAKRARLVDAYERYREEQAALHLDGMDNVSREAALHRKIEEVRSQFRSVPWTTDSLRSVATATLCSELAADLPLLDFSSFVAQTVGSEQRSGQPVEEGA